MRHLVKKHKLNKAKSHREAMLKNLAAQVIQYEHVDTTSAKAKAVLPLIDKMINIGKKNNIQSIRRLHQKLYDELAIKKIQDVLAKRYENKNSGYASIIKIKNRSGDNAQIVRIMLTEE